MAARSRGVSTRPRRSAASRLDRQTFRAIVKSHADASAGRTPPRSAACARRNVLCTASSASSREPSRLRQKR